MIETVKHQHPPGHLYFLREEIAALCVVKCRMSHERVIRAGEPMLPVICRYTESNYERVGLCGPEVRAKRLGCSHTSARIKLEDAINELNTRDEEGNRLGRLLSSELNWLNNQIHLLDHRRGEAEKTLARMLEDAYRAGGWGHKGKNLIEAENRIQELERAHNEYVERIGQLRDRIIIEIDKLIAPTAGGLTLRTDC
jgi:hypothetical protein